MMRINDTWAIDDRIERVSDGALATIMSITLHRDSVIVGIMYDVADAHGDYFASWLLDALRAEFKRPGGCIDGLKPPDCARCGVERACAPDPYGDGPCVVCDACTSELDGDP